VKSSLGLQEGHFVVENLLVHHLAISGAHARVDQDASCVLETDSTVEIGKDLDAGAHDCECVGRMGRRMNEKRRTWRSRPGIYSQGSPCPSDWLADCSSLRRCRPFEEVPQIALLSFCAGQERPPSSSLYLSRVEWTLSIVAMNRWIDGQTDAGFAPGERRAVRRSRG